MEKKLIAFVLIALLGGLGGGYALKTLSKPSSPMFTIADFRITRENFFEEQRMGPGLTIYLIVQNIGDVDAHDVQIITQDVFINHTGNIHYGGEARLDVLEPSKSHDFIVPFKWSGVGGGTPMGINIAITCKEGINQSFFYSYELGVVYSIVVIDVFRTAEARLRGIVNITAATIRNMGNWTLNEIWAIGRMSNGTYYSQSGVSGIFITPGSTYTVRVTEDKYPIRPAYIVIWIPTDYNWIHLVVDVENI